MFAMMLWFLKCLVMSQSVEGKSASAVSQVEGSGEEVDELPAMSAGMEDRGKYQALIPAGRISRAYTCQYHH